jgi:phosphoribosylglycinamide formyltransferase
VKALNSMAEQDTSNRCRIVVAASGKGSNFQAVIDGVASGRIPDSVIVHLFHNKKDAYARQRAQMATPPIPVTYFNVVSQGFQAPGEKDPAKKTEARNRYDAALAQEMLLCKPDLIVLAGWMHVFSEHFLEPLDAAGVKIINLHPALPGASKALIHDCKPELRNSRD